MRPYCFSRENLIDSWRAARTLKGKRFSNSFISLERWVVNNSIIRVVNFLVVKNSIYSKEFLRDGEIMVTDAILSSCAAPFYFQPHRFSVRNRSYCQSDGGLWANDPIMCGITEALGSRFNVRLEDIRVLSLQNGAEIPSDIGQGDDNWRWDIAKFAELVFYLQSHTAQNQADLLLKTKNPDAPKAILKIDVEKKGNKSWKLDDCSCIEELDRHAQEIYDNKAPEIRRFLGFED